METTLLFPTRRILTSFTLQVYTWIYSTVKGGRDRSRHQCRREPIAELEHGCSPFGLATEAPLLTMGPHYRQHAGVRQSLNQPRHERSVVIHRLTSGSCEQRASSAWELGLHDGEHVIDALISSIDDQKEETAVLMEVVAALDRIRSW